MVDEQFLAVYLNDHLAGATVGRALARRAYASNSSLEFRPYLGKLAGEIDEDRRSLLEVMRRVGVVPSRVKRAVAVVGERLGRLKVNGQMRGYSPLSRVVELEGLALGLQGKLACWRTLSLASEKDPRFHGLDFDALIERAARQLEELEEHRRRAVALL